MASAARDLDLNSGQPPFEAFDSHITSSDSTNPITVLDFNLNEDCGPKPSLPTVEFEGNSNIDQHEHGHSESYDPLMGVEKVENGRSFLQGMGVSVVGSAEVGEDVVNRSGKEDGHPHLGLDSADIALESNGDIGILRESAAKEDGLSGQLSAAKEDGLSGKVSPKGNPKVSPLEEDFDRHPVKDASALHETSNTMHNSTGHSQEQDDCTSTEHVISVGDLVWGKVRSHPWWPGQVFDPSDASELARQHQKKDRLLVAYFGDETFAWVEKSNLKHFQENFAELSKQSTGKAFGKAVGQAVDELARRVQIGLACACLSDQTCITLENKSISSVGLCKGVLVAKSHRDVSMFDPRKLLTSLQELAKYPATGNALEIATFLAQVSVFYALHRHRNFGKSSSMAFLQDESGFKSGMVSKRTPSTPKHVKISDDSHLKQTRSSNNKQSLKKRKRLFDDSQGYDVFEDEDLLIENNIETPKRVVKQSAESVSARKASLSATKKPRTSDHSFASGSDGYFKGSKTQHVKKDMHSGSSKSIGDADVRTKKTSKAFRLGECISKIASQLIKSVDPTAEDTPEKGAENTQTNDKEHILSSPSSFSKSPLLVMEESSVNEILLELFQVAQNPMQCVEENDIFSRVTSVFLKFRDEVFEKDSVYPSYRRSSRISSKLTASSYMDDDSDDMSDIDKRIASKRKGHSPRRYFKRKAGSQGRESAQKPKHHSILSNSSSSKKVKKLEDHIKFPDSISSKGDTLSNADDLKESLEESPTALFMKFPPGLALPSELELKEIFGCFGQIAETQLFSDSGCAQVIFRRCSDAEAAFHGATANKVFGPATVSLRLRFLSSRTKTQNDDLRKDEMSITSEDRNP